MTKRTDIHRSGAIIPANYEYRLSYHLATMDNGWPIPPFNIDLIIELQSSQKFAAHGGLGRCTVCGASYIYGDVWIHTPTQEHIHVGHECAAKYEMLADRSAFELEAGCRKAAAGRACERAAKAEERAAFLASHSGLAEALAVKHHIVADIAQRFQQYCDLSEKQIALVMKIAAEANKPRAEEKLCAAPTATAERQTFRGVVVSTKSVEGFRGRDAYKMTVKVTTADGSVWLAWGTIPSGLLESVPIGEQGRIYTLRGMEVEITATLQAGRDAHFAIMKRPVGRLVNVLAVADAASAAKEVAS